MTRRRKKEWPPPFEWSQTGPVPVELTPDLQDAEVTGLRDGQRLAGLFSPYERTIRLDAALPERPMRVVLHHEWLHLAIHDAGIGLPEDVEETLVHALATALVAREDFHAAGGLAEQPAPSKRKRR